MKTREQIIEAFQRAVELFSRYRMHRQRRDRHGLDNVIEAGIRLRQASYFLARFRECELAYKATDETCEPQARAALAHELRELGDAIKTHGEAFYYFAWRAREALCLIPRFEVDVIGLRDVRNRLIEHPNKTNGFFVNAWKFDCEEGLVLGLPEMGGPGLDRGLYPNAAEFIDKLLPRLEQAVADFNEGGATNAPAK